MPTTTTHLTEDEIKVAVMFWIDQGCPKPRVSLHVDRPRNATQFDPGNGVTATVSER